MMIHALLKVDGKIRHDVRVDCERTRSCYMGMLTERNGNRLKLPEKSEKKLVFDDKTELNILVGSTKYYDTLAFISEPN